MRIRRRFEEDAEMRRYKYVVQVFLIANVFSCCVSINIPVLRLEPKMAATQLFYPVRKLSYPCCR